MWNLSESPLHFDLGFFVNRNKNEVIFGERWGFLVCEDVKLALLFNIPLRQTKNAENTKWQEIEDSPDVPQLRVELR